MKSTILPHFEDYLSPQNPNIQPTVLCIDDRKMYGVDTSLQIPGGVIGLALDVIVGTALGNRESEILRDNRAVGSYARVIAGILRAEGIEAGLHTSCAAEDGIVQIARDITAEDPTTVQSVFSYASELHPGLTVDQAKNGAEIYASLLNRYKIQQPSDTIKLLNGEPNDGEERIHRYVLSPAPHRGIHIIGNWRKDSVFNTGAAYADGYPAYHISFAAIAEDILPHIQPVLPVDTENFLAAMAIRAGAVANNLPLPEGTERFTTLLAA